MLVCTDLTTPDLSAKPDLQALFLVPLKNFLKSKGIDTRFDQIHGDFLFFPFFAKIKYNRYIRKKSSQKGIQKHGIRIMKEI